VIQIRTRADSPTGSSSASGSTRISAAVVSVARTHESARPVEGQSHGSRHWRRVEQFGGLDVEFVIAEHGVINAECIPRINHLCAFIRSRFDRRRKRIAAERENRVRIFFNGFFFKRQKSRQTAALSAFDGHKLINVVDVKNGYANRSVSLRKDENRRK
jgi:hypothetical protein